MRIDDLFGVVGRLMRKPRTKDDYWYNKITEAEPKKIYRYCPKCGSKVGIPEIYATKYCFMCNAVIYVDERKNEEMRKKYAFMRKLKQKGLKLNDKDKRNIRGKKVSKEI